MLTTFVRLLSSVTSAGGRTDCVYMAHGFGVHASELRRANNRGVGDEEMLPTYVVDPIMGGTAMRHNFVKIVKEG